MNKLRFYLNKKLDKRMAEQFLDVRGGGIDFGEGIIKTHPQLRSIKSLKEIAQREKVIRVYFDNYYQIHRTAMLRKLKRVQDAWHKKNRNILL